MKHRRLIPPLLAALALAGCQGDPEPPAQAAVETSPADPCAGELMLHVPSPDWRDQVIYMMFIDRFDDGDPTNNDHGAGEYVSNSPAHFNGGDMQGIIDRIPYLQELGATTVWITPPVLNQWWSTPYAAAGWHGYWAANFKEVDPHFGTLETYQQLSHQLHCNDMYLVQDIVGNHVGNYYAWDGEYNPADPAENFYLIEEKHQEYIAPTQYPFSHVDIRNPEHRATDAYHWTPAITDYNDPYQQVNYGFGLLADINSENPLVLEAFKDSYRHWIEEVGVDGYRVDTVGYVPFEFWNNLLHDDDGLFASAQGTGREHFLIFGEVLVPSEPFMTDGEDEIVSFFGTDESKGLNSMLGFPLYFSMRRVLSEGRPAAQLAYRLEQHLQRYPDPYVIPIFIDNHDTARFLGTGSMAAFRQALALIFTIPGIPVIYQGTEQALLETRQSMFAGGWLADTDLFDTGSEPYQHIRELAELRTGNPIYTRGEMTVLAGDELNAGLLAYRRDHEDETLLVLMNTADHSILVHQLDAGLAPVQALEPVYALEAGSAVQTDSEGLLNLELPGRAFLVLKAGAAQASSTLPDEMQATPPKLVITQAPGTEILTGDFELRGAAAPGAELSLITNGNLDRVETFSANEQGEWSVQLPVRDLGLSEHYLQVYDQGSSQLSDRISYRTRVDQAELELEFDDNPDDAYGAAGNYTTPQHPDSGRQREIESVRIRTAGRNLEMTLTMAEITDVWVPPHGFDNVAISTFFSFPDSSGGAQTLPMINADMPDGGSWDLAHVASGWFSYTYRSAGASEDRQGDKLGVSPYITSDKEARTITFFFEGDALGVDSWDGVKVYITTWDFTGEGSYVIIQQEPSMWYFGGAEGKVPLILDDLLLELPVQRAANP